MTAMMKQHECIEKLDSIDRKIARLEKFTHSVMSRDHLENQRELNQLYSDRYALLSQLKHTPQ